MAALIDLSMDGLRSKVFAMEYELYMVRREMALRYMEQYRLAISSSEEGFAPKNAQDAFQRATIFLRNCAMMAHQHTKMENMDIKFETKTTDNKLYAAWYMLAADKSTVRMAFEVAPDGTISSLNQKGRSNLFACHPRDWFVW